MDRWMLQSLLEIKLLKYKNLYFDGCGNFCNAAFMCYEKAIWFGELCESISVGLCDKNM